MPHAKYDRINQLVALAIRNHRIPGNCAFVDWIIRISASQFAMGRRVSKAYAGILIDAFYGDHWKNLAAGTPYLSEEEKLAWNDAGRKRP